MKDFSELMDLIEMTSLPESETPRVGVFHDPVKDKETPTNKPKQPEPKRGLPTPRTVKHGTPAKDKPTPKSEPVPTKSQSTLDAEKTYKNWRRAKKDLEHNIDFPNIRMSFREFVEYQSQLINEAGHPGYWPKKHDGSPAADPDSLKKLYGDITNPENARSHQEILNRLLTDHEYVRHAAQTGQLDQLKQHARQVNSAVGQPGVRPAPGSVPPPPPPSPEPPTPVAASPSTSKLRDALGHRPADNSTPPSPSAAKLRNAFGSRPADEAPPESIPVEKLRDSQRHRPSEDVPSPHSVPKLRAVFGHRPSNPYAPAPPTANLRDSQGHRTTDNTTPPSPPSAKLRDAFGHRPGSEAEASSKKGEIDWKDLVSKVQQQERATNKPNEEIPRTSNTGKPPDKEPPKPPKERPYKEPTIPPAPPKFSESGKLAKSEPAPIVKAGSSDLAKPQQSTGTEGKSTASTTSTKTSQTDDATRRQQTVDAARQAAASTKTGKTDDTIDTKWKMAKTPAEKQKEYERRQAIHKGLQKAGDGAQTLAGLALDASGRALSRTDFSNPNRLGAQHARALMNVAPWAVGKGLSAIGKGLKAGVRARQEARNQPKPPAEEPKSNIDPNAQQIYTGPVRPNQPTAQKQVTGTPEHPLLPASPPRRLPPSPAEPLPSGPDAKYKQLGQNLKTKLDADRENTTTKPQTPPKPRYTKPTDQKQYKQLMPGKSKQNP